VARLRLEVRNLVNPIATHIGWSSNAPFAKVNLDASREEGAGFEPELLRLATVVR